MITKYVTYVKECPTDKIRATEFEFVTPKLKKEYESISHEMINVTVADGNIYYTFRMEIRLKGARLAVANRDDEEVSPFER